MTTPRSILSILPESQVENLPVKVLITERCYEVIDQLMAEISAETGMFYDIYIDGSLTMTAMLVRAADKTVEPEVVAELEAGTEEELLDECITLLGGMLYKSITTPIPKDMITQSFVGLEN